VKHVRISAKAIIIEHGRLLVLQKRDSIGDWFVLPGGGQHHGETLTDALLRECAEEIGCAVQIGRVRFLRDYIARHHEFGAEDDGHAVEVMFECQLLSAPCLGPKPDRTQIGFEWLDVRALSATRLYPKVLQELLASDAPTEPARYLGDVN
jgi:8-oxo-dGTP pyrophosphatase MutT (NUDIX family)